ncbi:Cys-tRNA(Pro) deacylase [Lentilactobacillus laojiaonis]|uniref:Cys-tRNA(Pro) deacylase n=1 Tax=Lentilactobacillus laojiaonis TaxID=2883998 RepID=UPI001D0A5B4C|nr:Cys-tRNA(Pro) deacylase [Lentilactobacillus laojiaonis]UDM32219.1 Cys-tRNA(Pro) deacylase [Lentilactobacillus laojiaonis]
MSKKNKSKIKKTLVEQILDKHKIPYEQMVFETYQDGDVAQLNIQKHAEQDQHLIYKTLALIGDKTGPLVGVLPIDEHLSYKKLAKASGNKKVGMVPLKDLVKTTGYEHGANTPIGIWEKHKYPIYLDTEANEADTIMVSSGQIGRSVKLNPHDLINLVQGTIVDLKE